MHYDYSRFKHYTFTQESYLRHVFRRQISSITARLKQEGFTGIWASDFDGSLIENETLFTASRQWSPVIDATTGRQQWHEWRRQAAAGELTTARGFELELRDIFTEGRTLDDCLTLLKDIIQPVDSAGDFLHTLNCHSIALVVVSNGPQQVVHACLEHLGLLNQRSPKSRHIFKTPVIANLMSCANESCNQKISCGNCKLSLFTIHGDVGVNKGRIIKRLNRHLPVQFTTGDSLGGDGSMIEKTVRVKGSALIRPSENPQGGYNNLLLEWAQDNLPPETFMGFDSYHNVTDFALSKLVTRPNLENNC